ncbi:MAG: hypothetical protein KME60_27670 [Cyanomargarita calcarea GSE-NOS-MK-12-04C]|jgi:hypothetical protein|uniref:Uncharacterized protein n=1 Tax=Cyanomargarita calcarea GSE-NOS-MK-12-04C TaxID=2839659 RepID=A0A951UYL8_9CYAN|nr:hypothetical protein [Cyanomargarita calcarea GSE-NOS-MK-12-04C]
MARAIERIERDILALEEAIRAIAQELQSTYSGYFTVLGQALRQQLILATYHLCTQGYPESFLSLSLNQRQKLQQDIRKLGNLGAEQLLNCMNANEAVMNWGDREDEGDKGDEEINSSIPPSPPLPLSPSSSIDLSNPIELVKWQQNLEEVMQQTLSTVSRDANVLLKKSGILPKKLPEPILEAVAAASEASGEVMPGPPNLLSLVVQIDREDDSEDSSLTEITTINLRLGEIEFADLNVSAGRKQIRYFLTQLNKLGREYTKKLQERSVAEAEAAWRASWYEN